MTLTDHDREHVEDILQHPKKDWFTAKLMRMIAQADKHHRGLLAKGFPEEVALVERHLGRELSMDEQTARIYKEGLIAMHDERHPDGD